MTYDDAISKIKNTIETEGFMIGTFKDGEVEYNVLAHEDAKYLLVYESESGFFIKDAIDDNDMNILVTYTNPKSVIAL